MYLLSHVHACPLTFKYIHVPNIHLYSDMNTLTHGHALTFIQKQEHTLTKSLMHEQVHTCEQVHIVKSLYGHKHM